MNLLKNINKSAESGSLGKDLMKVTSHIFIVCLVTIICSICFGFEPTITSFNNGQVTPLLEGRVDYDRYSSSLRLAENMLVTVQGPVERRPGTKFISDVFSSGQYGFGTYGGGVYGE